MPNPENTSTNGPTSGTAAIEEAANQLMGVKPTGTEVTQGEPADTSNEALGENGKKALQAEREARTAAERRAADFKAKLDQIEAANMSELERAQKAATEAQAEAATARTDALRFRIASQHGISEEDADLFLTGTDADTLTKQATRLKERTPTTPKPDPSQGAQHATALNGDGLTEALSRAVGAR